MTPSTKARKDVEHSRPERSCYTPAGTSRAETAAFAALGLAALCAVVLAAVSGSRPSVSTDGFLSQPPGSTMTKYVRSGRLAADVRTAHALLLYLLSPDPPVLTRTGEAVNQ